jgi:hypothetical protein
MTAFRRRENAQANSSVTLSFIRTIPSAQESHLIC